MAAQAEDALHEVAALKMFLVAHTSQSDSQSAPAQVTIEYLDNHVASGQGDELMPPRPTSTKTMKELLKRRSPRPRQVIQDIQGEDEVDEEDSPVLLKPQRIRKLQTPPEAVPDAEDEEGDDDGRSPPHAKISPKKPKIKSKSPTVEAAISVADVDDDLDDENEGIEGEVETSVDPMEMKEKSRRVRPKKQPRRINIKQEASTDEADADENRDDEDEEEDEEVEEDEEDKVDIEVIESVKKIDKPKKTKIIKKIVKKQRPPSESTSSTSDAAEVVEDVEDEVEEIVETVEEEEVEEVPTEATTSSPSINDRPGEKKEKKKTKKVVIVKKVARKNPLRVEEATNDENEASEDDEEEIVEEGVEEEEDEDRKIKTSTTPKPKLRKPRVSRANRAPAPSSTALASSFETANEETEATTPSLPTSPTKYRAAKKKKIQIMTSESDQATDSASSPAKSSRGKIVDVPSRKTPLSVRERMAEEAKSSPKKTYARPPRSQTPHSPSPGVGSMSRVSSTTSSIGGIDLCLPRYNASPEELELRQLVLEKLSATLAENETNRVFNIIADVLEDVGITWHQSLEALWNTLQMSKRSLDFFAKIDKIFEGIVSLKGSTSRHEIGKMCSEIVPMAGTLVGSKLTPLWQEHCQVSEDLLTSLLPYIDQNTGKFSSRPYDNFFHFNNGFSTHQLAVDVAKDASESMHFYLDESLSKLNDLLLEVLLDWSDSKNIVINMDGRIEREKSSARRELESQLRASERQIDLANKRLEVVRDSLHDAELKVEEMNELTYKLQRLQSRVLEVEAEVRQLRKDIEIRNQEIADQKIHTQSVLRDMDSLRILVSSIQLPYFHSHVRTCVNSLERKKI